MLEGRLEEGRHGRIADQGSSIYEGLVNPGFEANKNAAWKPLLSEQPDFPPLFKSSLLALIRLLRKFGLVNLEIEPFRAPTGCQRRT